MTEQDYIVREIFAYYGSTMYMAQTIEKGFMNLVVTSHHKYKITKTRYDEILYEKASLTFGQLKREIKDINIFSEEELLMIDKFHEIRDFLAHSFWWDRSVEFYDETQQHKLLIELDEMKVFFETINDLINEKMQLFIDRNGIDIETIYNELISQGKTIPLEKFRKLNKNEQVVELFAYKNTENSVIPIFKLEDGTFWTLCEVGLTQYKFEIIEVNKLKLKKIDDIFPINQFNPRPKIENHWNYELDLKKKGLKMVVEKENVDSPMKWSIKA
ncbi:MAG: hypothetical protein WCR52_19705 [Bacteroidota bacterium]